MLEEEKRLTQLLRLYVYACLLRTFVNHGKSILKLTSNRVFLMFIFSKQKLLQINLY